jgi:hypothetical protein
MDIEVCIGFSLVPLDTYPASMVRRRDGSAVPVRSRAKAGDLIQI